MSADKKAETKPENEKWGIHVSVPHDLDKAKEADLQESVSKLVPHFIEVVAKAHGINVSGSTANIKR